MTKMNLDRRHHLEKESLRLEIERLNNRNEELEERIAIMADGPDEISGKIDQYVQTTKVLRRQLNAWQSKYATAMGQNKHLKAEVKTLRGILNLKDPGETTHDQPINGKPTSIPTSR